MTSVTSTPRRVRRAESAGRALAVPATAVHATVIGGALALWALSLTSIDVGRMTDKGLPSVLPDTFYVAALAVLTGFVVTVWRSPHRTGVLALYLIAVIAVMDATTPLLYEVPRYASTYKHLAVTDFIAATGSVDRTVDIYNNWPGFFALTAWLQSASGMSMERSAEWAPLVFDLLNVLVVQYALGALTRDRRRIWIASLLFLLGSWMGQNYYSPQAEGFVLSLIVLGTVLRCTAPRRLPRFLAVFESARAAAGEPAARPRVRDEAMARRTALVVGGAAYLALVVTHQLSPVMILASIAGLAILRRIPFTVVAAMAAAELAWLALAWPYLSSSFNLLDPKGVDVPRMPGVHPLPGVQIAARASNLSELIVIGLAFVGTLRLAWARRLDLPAAVLIVAPFPVAFVQTYGGEGIIRAYLFALPWLALLASGAFIRLVPRVRLPGWRPAALGATAVALFGTYLVANTGMELINRMTTSDVAAVRWYETNTPAHSTLVPLSLNFPAPISAVYPTHYGPGVARVAPLSEYPVFRQPVTMAQRVAAVAWFASSQRGQSVYVALTPVQRRYFVVSGLLTERQLRGFDAALTHSPLFRLVYYRDGSSIYRYAPPRSTP